MPGTGPAIGVLLAGTGEITLRSVTGVNAKGGSPASELLAGVVAAPLVVRSGLSKQTTSRRRLPNRAVSSSQGVAAARPGANPARTRARPLTVWMAGVRFTGCSRKEGTERRGVSIDSA
jgi:hypothetical protein